MEPSSPPATPPPAAPAAAPKMSSTVLYIILAIAVIVIAAIFGFILVYVSGLTNQLWWMGLMGLIFALVFYMIFASTHNRTVVMPLSGAFFVIGIGSFYGSILSDTSPSSDPLNKLILIVIESIFVVIVLTAIYMMSRQGERDKIRKSQRKVTP